MLRQSGKAHRLIVLTDSQASNWQGVGKHLTAALPKDTQITVIPLGLDEAVNLGLAKPQVTPATIVADRPADVSVLITNDSDRPRSTDIALAVNGQQTAEHAVSLAPHDHQRVHFTVHLTTDGMHRFTFSIPGDALAVDNHAYLVVNAARRTPVLVVGDDAPDQPGTSTYFTMRALMPFSDQRDRYEVRHLTTAEVGPAQLTRSSLVVVTYASPMATATAKALNDYIRTGGSVLLFGGNGPVAANLKALAEQDEHTALPWQPGPRRDLQGSGDLLRLSDGDWHAEALRTFGPTQQMALQQIRFLKVWGAGRVNPEAHVLLRFSDGSPALASQRVGAGWLLVAAFSPALDVSDMGKYGSFVALVQSLAAHFGRTQPASLPGTPGQAMTLLIPNAKPQTNAGALQLTGPDDVPVSNADFAWMAHGLSVSIPRPTKPGFYRVAQGPHILSFAAANVDGRESDLRRMPAETLKKQLAAVGLHVRVDTVDHAQASVHRHATPLWGWMLAAALLVLGVEMLLVSYWRR